MQLFYATLGIFAVLLPSTGCFKKEVKFVGKHPNKTTISKNGKRWMSSSLAQNYINSQPMQSYSSQYKPEAYPTQHDQIGYGDAPPGFGTPPSAYEDQSFQGLKEMKVGKQNDVEQSPNMASDMSSFLKPGIGDYPSDMPGVKSFDQGSLHGVGLPISGKLKSTKLTPVASFGEEAALDEVLNALNSHKAMMTGSSSPVIPTADGRIPTMADSMSMDTSYKSKFLDATPSKISEASPSDLDSTKSFSEPEESPIAVTPDPPSSPLSSDTSSETSSQTKDEPEISDKEKLDPMKSDQSNKQTEKPAADTGETSVIEKPSEKLDSKSNDSGMIVKQKQETTGSRRENGDEDQGQKSVTVTSDDGQDISSNSTVEEEVAIDPDKTPNKVKEKLVSSLREALLENVKEMLKGENSKQLLEEVAKVATDKVNNKTKEEEEGSAGTSPLRKHVDTHAVNEDVHMVNESVHAINAGANALNEGVHGAIESVHMVNGSLDKTPNKKEAKDGGNDYLEDNLMKLDKKKLVHLLASIMRKYKESALQTGDLQQGDVGKEKLDDELSQIKLDKEEEDFLSEENEGNILSKLKLHEQAVSREKFNPEIPDPYAQIGLTDPKNSENDPKTSGRHSVHINLYGNEMMNKNDSEKENEGKEETATSGDNKVDEALNDKVEKEKQKIDDEEAKHNEKEKEKNAATVKQKQKQGDEAKIAKLKAKAVSQEIKENSKDEKEFLHAKLKGKGDKQAEIEEAEKGAGDENVVATMMESSPMESSEKEIQETDNNEKQKTAKERNESEVSAKEGNQMESSVKESNQRESSAKEGNQMESSTKESNQVESSEKESDMESSNTESNEKESEKVEGDDGSVKGGNVEDGTLKHAKQTKERDKEEAEREELKVEAELEKEKEELKLLKEEERVEKAKEEELKAANAALKEKSKDDEASLLEKVKEEALKVTEEGDSKQTNGAEDVAKDERVDADEREDDSKESRLEAEREENKKEEKERLKLFDENLLKEDNNEAEKMLQLENEKDIKVFSTEEEKEKNAKDISVEKDKDEELNAMEKELEESIKNDKANPDQSKEETEAKETEEKDQQYKKLRAEKLKEAERETKVDADKQKDEKAEYEQKVSKESKGKQKRPSHDLEYNNATNPKTEKSEEARYIHLVSPELVDAITSKLQTGKDFEVGESSPNHKQSGRNNELSLQEKSSSSKGHSIKQEKPFERKEDNVLDGKQGKNSDEPTTVTTKTKDNREKSKEFVSTDGPNIEVLIRHMEQRMRDKKKEKAKEESKNVKDAKRLGHLIDDAYSQIGSLDPNVKRRRILNKVKKRLHKRHFKRH